MNDERKNNVGTCGGCHSESQNHYGTFQGVANYHPSYQQQQLPVPGFPQPIPPLGSTGNPLLYPNVAYQAVPGYALIDGRHYHEHRLPCCGLGMGWFLFIIGFFLGGLPWYVGAFIAVCVQVDYREKPGYVACAIAAVLAMIAVTLGVTKDVQSWGDHP